ncbi:MAG: hypothetical protein ACRD7E_18230 [Bryobacteraceae bacterium]
MNAVRSPGFWSLTDQGVVSLGNFLIHVLLARAMSQDLYGIYALMYGVMLVLNNVHASLVIYPLSVTGATADREGLLRRCTGASVLTLGLSLLNGAVLMAVFASSTGFLAAGLAAVALLAWQWQETVRCAFRAHLNHRNAVAGDTVRYLGQAAVVGVFCYYGKASLEMAFAAIALASVVAGLIQALQLRLRPIDWESLREMPVEYWKLGRWVLPAAMLAILIMQAFPWMLALLYGSAAAAGFQALANVVGPVRPVMFSVGNLIIPTVSQAYQAGGLPSATRPAVKYAIQGAVLILPYSALLFAFPDGALRLLYGSESGYLALGSSLGLVVVSQVIYYLGHVIGAYLGGLRENRFAFLSEVSCALTVMFIGIPLIWTLGLTGAFVALTLAAVAKTGTSLYFCSRLKLSAEQSPAVLVQAANS